MLEATIGSSPCFLKILHIARRSSISAEAITICQGTFIRTLPRSEMLYRANTRKARAGAVHLRGADFVYFVDWGHGRGESCSALALPRACCFSRSCAQAGFTFGL